MKTRSTLALAASLAAVSFFAATAPAEPSLLPAGTAAPDFSAFRADNTPVKLSDYAGKIVLVDFWATWCGPCKMTMPHMESLHTKLESQGLMVLGVCVWDTQAKFDAWQAHPEVPTTYLKVIDRAGSEPNNIASSLYHVSGIPTFYLVGKDGKILYSGIGAGPQTEAGLDRALASAGFKL